MVMLFSVGTGKLVRVGIRIDRVKFRAILKENLFQSAIERFTALSTLPKLQSSAS